MKHDFETALDDCLRALRLGESVDACLERYPQYSEDLRPLLETASLVSSVQLPAPRAEAMRRSRERMFQESTAQFGQQAVSTARFSRYVGEFLARITGKEQVNMKTTTRFAVALMVLVLLAVSGLGVNLVSANALPGDFLYPAKRLFEQARLVLTIDPQAHEAFKEELQARRQFEVRTVLEMRRQVRVEFTGELTDVTASTWNVGGFVLQLDANTRITGEPVIGAHVEVQALVREDGSLQAQSLSLQPVGTPEATHTPYPMPSDTPQPILPTHTMMPTQTQMPGNTMMPTQTQMPGNTMMPTQTQMPGSTMMPTHTQMPGSTMMPTHTQMPEHTPMPTHTQMPGGTMMPTHTQMPEHTPMPTHTQMPGGTMMPSQTPMPTHTQMPGGTMMPSQTPMPGGTMMPTQTQMPGGTMMPTQTQMPGSTMMPSQTPMPGGTMMPPGGGGGGGHH